MEERRMEEHTSEGSAWHGLQLTKDARERHVAFLAMEESKETGPVRPTSKPGLRNRFAALPVLAKVVLIVALVMVVAY